MNRNISILSVMVMMTVTVMATVTVAFATPNEGGNGQTKVEVCHKGQLITVAEPAVAAHQNHGDDLATELCENPDVTTPELTTVATAPATEPATLGDPISDTATLSGATSDATGTIAFKLYGPFTGSDPNLDECTADKLVFETVPSPGTPSHVPIGSPDQTTGNYVVDSPEYTTTAVGRYQWVVSYSGDASNGPVSSECKALDEASVVTESTPTSTTE